jgi:hypothetical protein
MRTSVRRQRPLVRDVHVLQSRLDPHLSTEAYPCFWTTSCRLSEDGASDEASALELAGAAERFWFLRGYYTEGRGWYGRVLRLDAQPDSRGYLERGDNSLSAGTPPTVQSDEALRTSRSLGFRPGVCWSLLFCTG